MFEELLESLASQGQLVHVEQQPARPSRTALLAEPLPDEVLKRLGINFLWSHQAEALNLVRDGHSVVVATGTASGKSLVYQAAIAEAVGRVDPASALLIFPTKALAQDQLRGIAAPSFPGLVAATYDGDTEAPARAWVRRHANVVLTNPEMLHVGMLPFHARWATFLRRLRYVVIDELHVFRGIFGTHVAHVLRRLRRLCARYGASPVFIFTSATVGEPAALAEALCRVAGGCGARRRVAARRTALRVVEPTAARHRDGHPRVAERRGRRAHRSAAGGGFAHGHVLPQPQGHRDRGGRCPTTGRRRPRREGAFIPRRLPPDRAPGDRVRAVRWPACGRRRDERPRARHRRRRARRVRDRRVPRNRRFASPAGRTRGVAPRSGRSRCSSPDPISSTSG